MIKLQEPQTPKGSTKFSELTVFGYIPNHWKMQKLKFSSQITLGKMLCPQNMGGYFLKPYLKSKNIQWMKVDLTSVDQMWFSKNELALYRLKKGDLILSEGGEVGKTCYWNDEIDECYIQNSAHKVRFNKENEPRYFLYQLFIAGHVGHFDSIVNRVSISHLTKDKLANMKFVHPPRREQKAIATYLDQKSTQIENAIAIKQRQIALLKERRQILIQNAVTRGLAPNALMRDSGVEWVGEVPEHWEILANRSLFRERAEPGRAGLPLLSVSIHSGVSEQEVSEEDNIRGRIKIEDKSKYRRVCPGDIAFNMMRAWQGAIGAVKNEGMVSPAYVIATPSDKIRAEYFEYLYRSPDFVQQMDRFSKGITDFRKRLYWDSFKQLITLVPPIDEQEMIIIHISQESEKTEAGISLLERQILKLKEYKATLINSAVTGKIKVPGVVEATQEELETTP